MQDLTARQSQVLEYVTTHAASHGYPPTLREIAVHIGVTSTNAVAEHLRALERKGKIRCESATARGIVLADRAAYKPGRPVSLEPALRRILSGYTIIATQGNRVVEDLAAELAAQLAG